MDIINSLISNIVWFIVVAGILLAVITLNILNSQRKRSEPNTLSYEDWDFIELWINDQSLPAGNVFEVTLPTSEKNCFGFRYDNMGRETVIWATGNIKLSMEVRKKNHVSKPTKT